MKPKPPGSVNATGPAWLYDGDGQPIAECLNTPNGIAAAFVLTPAAVRVRATWPIEVNAERADYADRAHGLDLDYHRLHIRSLT